MTRTCLGEQLPLSTTWYKEPTGGGTFLIVADLVRNTGMSPSPPASATPLTPTPLPPPAPPPLPAPPPPTPPSGNEDKDKGEEVRVL